MTEGKGEEGEREEKDSEVLKRGEQRGKRELRREQRERWRREGRGWQRETEEGGCWG